MRRFGFYEAQKQHVSSLHANMENIPEHSQQIRMDEEHTYL